MHSLCQEATIQDIAQVVAAASAAPPSVVGPLQVTFFVKSKSLTANI